MRIQHWQDIASLLLGVWLLVSLFVPGFARGSRDTGMVRQPG
jgi:hypothetical protein